VIKISKITSCFVLANYWLPLSIVLLFFVEENKLLAQNQSRDVIVGELLGRVDPDDVPEMIKENYYPMISNRIDVNFQLVQKSSYELIYQLIYPQAASGQHPERVIFKFFDSEESLAAAIITDKIDFAVTESEEIAQEVHNATTSIFIHFRYKKLNYVKMLAYNNGHFILQEPNVRKALTYAIDRNYIKNNILKQRAYLADGPISDSSKFHVSSLEEYHFNPQKANQLLRSENWIDTDGDGILERNSMPFRINITYEKGVWLEEQIIRRIKIDWNKLGIDVIRNPLTRDEMKANLAARDYDVMLTNQQFHDTIQSFGAHFLSTSPENFLAYNSRTTDRYINLYKQMESPVTQKTIFQAIQNQINKDHPAAFLFFLWLERFFVNRMKFEHYVTKKKELLPFCEWEFRQ